jgi:iron(III) transport system ATP-binding protein
VETAEKVGKAPGARPAVGVSAAAPDAPAVRITGLAKQFGEFLAVRGLDLELAAGEFVTMLGPSGCGKTTTLRIIAGLERATAGWVELFGQPIVDVDKQLYVPPNRRELSMVFQSYALWPHMTVLQNVVYPLKKRRREVPGRLRGNTATDADLAMRALERVQCAHLRDRYPGEMSGGQQQRVALARAIVNSPRLVLLDEPLSNLDASLRRDMRLELRHLQEDIGFAALYVTHDQTEALGMSDRIVLMRDGQVEQIAEPQRTFDWPRTTFAASFIGDHNIVRGTVTGRADGLVKVETPLGPVTARPTGAHLDPADGATAVVAIRTDRIALHPLGPDQHDGPAIAAGTVMSTAYGGVHVDVVVQTDQEGDGQPRGVTVRDFSGALSVSRGDRVAFEVLGQPALTEVDPSGEDPAAGETVVTVGDD